MELLVSEEVTTEVAEEAENVDPESSKAVRKPNMNFFEMGIPEGAELIFVKEKEAELVSVGQGEHQCEVIDERKVRFEGSEYSLTPLTKKLIGKHRRPAAYWHYKGRKTGEAR